MKLTVSKLLQITCCLLVNLIGLTVLFGWYFHKNDLITMAITSQPMVYNAALGFLLLGINFITVIFHRYKSGLIFSFLILVLSSLTLVEYAFALDFSIDQLLMPASILFNPIYPGRMAPNTALCLLISGLIFVILNIKTKAKILYIIAVYLSLMVLTVAFIGIIGYVFGFNTGYMWTKNVRMAFHTCAAFIFLSVGLLATINIDAAKNYFNLNKFMPDFAAFAIGILTFLIWYSVNLYQIQNLQQLTKLKSEYIKKEILFHMDARIGALLRIKSRWENRENTPHDEWIKDIQNYELDEPAYKAISWVDSSMHVRWICPEAKNTNFINYDLSKDVKRRNLMDEALQKKHVVVSNMLDLISGGRGFLVVLPLFKKEQSDGYMFAVLNPNIMLDRLLTFESKSGYAVRVYDGEEIIYSINDEESFNLKQLTSISEVGLIGIKWKIEVWPTQKLYDEFANKFFSFLIIGIGGLIALLMYLLIRAMHKSLSNVKMLSKIKKDLSSANVQLNSILEGISIIVMAIDTNLEFISLNSVTINEFKKIYNTSLHVGINFVDILNDYSEEKNKIFSCIIRALKGEKFTQIEELGGTAAQKYYYEIHCDPIKDHEGNIIGMIQLMTNVSKRIQSESTVKTAKIELEKAVDKLRLRNREIQMINEMNSVLQACLTLPETIQPITHYCKEILADSSGVLYVGLEESQLLKEMTSWGTPLPHEPVIKVDDCWALRRNQIHTTENQEGALICHHLNLDSTTAPEYICIPLLYQARVMGMLHIENAVQNKSELPNKIVLSQMLAEQLSLILSNIQLRETLRHQSTKDPLTNLFNRRYFEESIHQVIYRAERDKIKFAIVMVDIDYFKKINDTYGHNMGDEILKNMALHLTQNTRHGDTICRWGGEEFILYLHDMDLTTVKEKVEQLRKRIEVAIFSKAENNIHITISLGIAIYPEHGQTLEALIAAADKALYQAKEEGRNCSVFATNPITQDQK